MAKTAAIDQAELKCYLTKTDVGLFYKADSFLVPDAIGKLTEGDTHPAACDSPYAHSYEFQTPH